MPVGDPWNPQQYERFRTERSQPFYDLMSLVHPVPDMRVIDLGCGTGELTAELHKRISAKSTQGIDSSESMLAKAATLPRSSGLTFERADIAALASAWSREPKERFDLVFSNAALHWLPSHEQLLSQITCAIAPGGQIAVQVPANDDHPTHTIAATIAAEPEYRDALAGQVRTSRVLPPERYAELLHSLGYADQHVRLVVYAHRLSGREDVFEWVRGTLLTDYEKRLSAPQFQQFVTRYKKLLLKVLRDERPYFFPFKRILFWASRP
jgi:trans-aconitate 2-methyltransferase